MPKKLVTVSFTISTQDEEGLRKETEALDIQLYRIAADNPALYITHEEYEHLT